MLLIEFPIFSFDAMQRLTYNILRALKYLHMHDITVRNLSPENIQITPEVWATFFFTVLVGVFALSSGSL